MVDAALERATTACLRGTDVAADPLVKRRLALPVKYMGGGLRKRMQVRIAAYAGSLITAVKDFSTRRARDGSVRVGFFPSLAPSLGGESYTCESALLGHYLAAGSPAAAALEEAWQTMRDEVADSAKPGPLDGPITGGAASIKAHLQREITKQRELAAVEKFKGEMKELMTEGAWGQIKPGDMRANAYLSCDGLSNQLLTALPNKHYFLSPTDFSDALARYLGCALPSIRLEGLEGKLMPCNSLSGEGRRRGRVCDAYGHEMELAKLPDNTVHAESTTLEKTVYGTLKYAGFDPRWQDKLMFKGSTSERPAIVPDVTCRLSYNDGPTLEYIYDIKTSRVSGSTLGYNTRASYDKPHGAMDARAAQVPREYLAKARKADRDAAAGAPSHNSDPDQEDEDFYLGVDTTTTPSHIPGPMETKLRAKPEPIGLCFGAYGEASKGVHNLIKVVAEELAAERGHELGVGKERQVGIFVQRVRCAWGMAAIRARARSRAMRKPLVGCSRLQAQGLVAGSCVAPKTRRTQGDAHLETLDAITWAEDSGSRMSRDARCEA